MYIFGYGSLMNAPSLNKTVPEAKIIEPVKLSGYKRIFDLKSCCKKNEDTGVYSSVLNIVKDDNHSFVGTLIDLPKGVPLELLRRETEYDMHDVVLDNGIKAQTFIGREHEPYPYVFDDPVQRMYLQICIDAAKSFKILDDFLNTTYIENKSIKELELDS